MKDVKLSFVEEFYHYLRTVKEVSKKGKIKEIGQNTAMKYCKNIKQVLDYAVKFEYIPSNPLHFFKCSNKKVKRTFLVQAELDVLYEKKIPITRLEEVRDCYLFSCYTGYAYSDARALTPDDIITGIDGFKWINHDRLKTDCKENIPLLPVALEIINKYKNHPYCVENNVLLPLNSNQNYNGYLKEIADLVGIVKRLTTHTARHTFATLMLTNGVPLETLKEMLGHEDIRTTQIYAQILDIKISKDMKQVQKAFTKRKKGQKQAA